MEPGHRTGRTTRQLPSGGYPGRPFAKPRNTGQNWWSKGCDCTGKDVDALEPGLGTRDSGKRAMKRRLVKAIKRQNTAAHADCPARESAGPGRASGPRYRRHRVSPHGGGSGNYQSRRHSPPRRDPDHRNGAGMAINPCTCTYNMSLNWSVCLDISRRANLASLRRRERRETTESEALSSNFFSPRWERASKGQ
jgi:hypothetical protein